MMNYIFDGRQRSSEPPLLHGDLGRSVATSVFEGSIDGFVDQADEVMDRQKLEEEYPYPAAIDLGVARKHGCRSGWWHAPATGYCKNGQAVVHQLLVLS